MHNAQKWYRVPVPPLNSCTYQVLKCLTPTPVERQVASSSLVDHRATKPEVDWAVPRSTRSNDIYYDWPSSWQHYSLSSKSKTTCPIFSRPISMKQKHHYLKYTPTHSAPLIALWYTTGQEGGLASTVAVMSISTCPVSTIQSLARPSYSSV